MTLPAKTQIEIAASILSADFSRLGEQVTEATNGGADYIHVDVMDGHFVQPLTLGPTAIRAIRGSTDIPLDIHMMVSSPEQFISDLAKAGADLVSVHAETCDHLHRVVQEIKNAGMKAGVAINPATPASVIEEVLLEVDLVLVMTVNPGYGGQKFIESTLPKIARVRAMLDERGSNAYLEVDGGISNNTAESVVRAGARILVAGSAVYESDVDVATAIAGIRQAALRAIEPPLSP